MSQSMPRDNEKLGLITRILSTVLSCSILTVFCVGSSSIQANTVDKSESMIRAAVIIGILRFTYWPEQKHPQEALNLCELGDSPSASAIRALDNSPTIGSLSINLVKVSPTDSFQECHGLVIGENVGNPVKLNASVLTFCDGCESSLNDVAAIVLSRNKNKIQFEVNLDLIVNNNISLSASVIELASKCVSSNPSFKGCTDGD